MITTFEELVAQKTGTEFRIQRVEKLAHQAVYRVHFKDDLHAPIEIPWADVFSSGIPVSDLEIYK